MQGLRIAVVTALLAWSGPALAQQPAAPPPPDYSKLEIKTIPLGNNAWMLEGQGGNITGGPAPSLRYSCTLTARPAKTAPNPH